MPDPDVYDIGGFSGWSLRSVAFGVAEANKQLIGGRCFLFGVSVVNVSATVAAELQVVGGGGLSTAAPLDYLLAANESARDLWPLPGWPFGGGVFLNVVAGSVRGGLAVAIPPGL